MKAKTLFVAALAALPFALFAEALVVGNETITYDTGDRTYDSLKMGDNGNNDITSTLNLSGDSSTTIGPITMGGSKSNTKSYLNIFGSATADLGNFTCLTSYTIANNRVFFSVDDDAVVTFGSFSCGSANNTHYADISFAGDSQVTQKAGCGMTVSYATTYFTMTAKDRAQVNLSSFTINKAGDQFKIQDNAKVTVSTAKLANRKDACDVSGDATLVITGQCFQVAGNGGLTLRDRARAFVSSTGMLQLSHNSGYAYLIITNSASLVSTNTIRCTRGYDSDSDHPMVYIYGGTLQFPGFNYGQYAPYSGYKHMDTLHVDGGTIKPMTANNNFIRYWQTAELAGAGLTLDTDGYATGICQAFTGTTFTKAGEGVLTVSLASTHGTTAVAAGTMLIATGVASFGNHLVVTNGATVSTAGTSTGFAVDEITLGDATSAGILNLDAGDTVTVATAAGLHFVNGKINHPSTGTDGTYDIFTVTSGVPTAEQLEGLSVYTKSLGRKYAFAAVADGDGAKIQLTVSTVTIVEDNWTGAVDGAWRTTGNWASGAYADEYTIATFPANAATKSVTIANADAANDMILEDAYTFTGAGSLTVGSIDVNAGTSTVDVALNVASSLPIANPAGTGLNLGGDMTGTEAVTVTKTGAGVMTVSGDNADYDGGWTTDGGHLVFDGDTAAGSADETTATWQLNGGTVVFTNGTQTIGRTVTMTPGSSAAMVVDAEGDTTIIGGLNSASGGYVQRGAGALTLRYGLGTKYLGKDVLGGMPSAAIEFPADGSSPASSSLAAINVLSGTLRLIGQGGSDTTWSEGSRGIVIGGNWADAPASARMEVSKGTLSNEGDKSVVVGNYVSSPAAARPTLSVGVGGTVSSSYTAIGRGSAGFDGAVYPTLAVTNGLATSFYDTSFGINGVLSRIHPIVRVGTGGSVVQRAGVGRAQYTGLIVGHDVDVEVADGGYLQANARNWGLYLGAAASGEFRFVNGGRLIVPFIASRGSATTTDTLKFVFDGGIYEPLNAHTTSVHNAAIRYVELRNGGMTFRTSYNHALAMRLTGSGDFTKEGTGVLTFPAKNDCTYHSDSTVGDDHSPNDDYVVLGDSGYKTLDFTGTLYVTAGSVVIEPGAARTGLKTQVASGKTLGFAGGAAGGLVIGGAGTYQNAVGGTLTLAAKTGVQTTLSNVQLDTLRIDFSNYGETLELGDLVTVAKFADGASAASIRSTGVGAGLRASFTVDADGNLVATIDKKPGTALIVR